MLPFASFVRFSHKENLIPDLSVNSVDDVASQVERNRLLVMYPGDVWSDEDGVAAVSELAETRYRRDWSEVAEQPLKSHEPSPMAKISRRRTSAFRTFSRNINIGAPTS